MENFETTKKWEPVDFTVYFSFIKWPVFGVLILEIILRFWADKAMTGPLFDNQEIIAWVLRLIMFSFLIWQVIGHFGYSPAVAALTGASAGSAVGLVIALYRFLDGVKIWKFFNLITETSLTAIVGAAFMALFIFLLSFKK